MSAAAAVGDGDSDGAVSLCPTQLSDGLKALSKLEGQIYGEVSIEAGNILRFAEAAPFQGRLSALREVYVHCHVSVYRLLSACLVCLPTFP